MRHLFRILIVLSVPVVLTMAMVRLLTFPWYPTYEYARPGFPADPFGLPLRERLQLAQASIHFLNIPGRTPILEELRLPDGEPAYNDRELEHMDDVKAVFTGLTLFAAVVAAASAAAWIALVRTLDHCAVWGALLHGGELTLAVLLGLAAWMLLGFDQFFTFFHGLFFQPGTWVFSYSDTLIRLFPLPFWQDAGLIVAGGVSLFSVVLVGVGTRQQRRCHQKAQESRP